MTMMRLIEYGEASAEVRAVYDDIMTTRRTDWINNFWKALANDPSTLRRTWESIKEVMAPGALDPLTKELIYLAVSASNGCAYCIASHGAAARKQGMTPEMLGERRQDLASDIAGRPDHRYPETHIETPRRIKRIMAADLRRWPVHYKDDC